MSLRKFLFTISLLVTSFVLYAQGDQPNVTLSSTSFTAQVNQYKFTSPTVIVKDSKGADVTNRFQVTYSIRGGAESHDDDGKEITKDNTTGTTITRLYGNVKIGDKAGAVTVDVKATPTTAYSGTYQAAVASYTINIPKVQPTVLVKPKADMGVAVGQTVSGPTFSLTYTDAENQVHTVDVTNANAQISYTIDGGDHITYDANNNTIMGKSAGTATIHYTLAPFAEYAATFDAVTRDVTVKVEQPSGKIATHLEFPKSEDYIYRNERYNVAAQTPRVIDAYGNDVTKYFNGANYQAASSLTKTKYTYYDWMTDKDVYFYNFKEDYATFTPFYGANGQLNGYWGDIPMKATASPQSWGEGLRYAEATGGYTLHVVKRAPETIVTINGALGSKLNLPVGYQFNFTATYHVQGLFTDMNTGEKTDFFQTNTDEQKINYFIKIPAEWKNLTDTYPYKGDADKYAEYTDSEGKSWVVFMTTQQHGTDPWLMTVDHEGTFEAEIFSKTYTDEKWDISASKPLTITFSKTIPVTMKAVPAVQTVYVGDQPVQPVVTVTNTALGDVTSHYTLTYKVNDPDGTGTLVDANTGAITKGTKPGNVTVDVTGTPMVASEGFQPASTQYVIHVLDATNRFTYEIVKTASPEDKDMGKMRITGAGDVPGGYIIEGVPGLTIQFGKEGEESWTAHNNNERLTVSGGPVSRIGDNNVPLNGTFYRLTPITNGFLTIDANIKGHHDIVLEGQDAEGTWYREDYTPQTDATGEHKFRYPLMAGGTYYLYNYGDGNTNDGLELHGLNFLPAYIYQRTTTEPVTKANIFTNGYAGTLPDLSYTEHSTVTYAITNDGHATIDTKTGAVTPTVQGPGDETVTATVNSATVTGVYRQPSYVLSVSAIPTYVVQDGEVLSVGQRLTTTNIPTRMFMTMGGWKDGVGPYVKYTYEEDGQTIKDVTSMLDGWKTAKLDLVGNPVDGFEYQSQGGQNATDEDMNPYDTGVDAKHTFANLPVRGTYLRFEPEESGTLMVYVLQNGACDYDEDEPAGATSYTALKYRPLFITDETGRNVEPDNNWNARDGITEGGAVNPDNKHRGYYTEGTLRTAMNDATIAKITGQSGELAFTWDAKFNNENDKNKLLDAWRGHKNGDPQEIIRLENGGYTLVSKAYVRYAIHVKAGKSYYVFQNGSKLGFAGFAFIPENYVYDQNNTTGIYTPDSDERTVILSDEADSYEPVDKENYHVMSNRILEADTWTSVCLPFSVSETQFKKVFGNDAKIITFNNIDKNDPDNWVINFDQHVYRMIVAGQPYFVRPSSKISLSFKHVSFEKEITAPIDGMTSEGITFKGTFTPTTMKDGSYYLSKTGLLKHLVNPKGATIKGLRAYMSNEGSPAQGAKMMMVWRDVDGEECGALTDAGETTGIDEIEGGYIIEHQYTAKGVYNLQGQLVARDATSINSLPKGVYIVDGRKVAVK